MLKYTKHIVKELCEIVRRPILRACSGALTRRAAALVTEIKREGFVVLPEHWSPAQCDIAKTAIDRLCTQVGLENSWVDELRSDHRFFRGEKHAVELLPFKDDPLIEEVRRGYTGRREAETFVLAARLDFRAGNKGSGGGWHLDSPHSRQFKAILYLSDCDTENGPFELIPKTHKRGTLLRFLVNGMRKPEQYRFTDAEVSPIVVGGYPTKTFTGSRGTLILVDVTALHRGTPIQNGSRYALTLYCGDPKIGATY